LETADPENHTDDCERRSGEERRKKREFRSGTDRRRSPEDAGTFAQRATRHAWKYALGEDVRGADVGEARELLLDMLADVCTNVHVHDYGALPGGIDLGKHADRILAALRSPEPAAEPVATFQVTGDHAHDAGFRILLGGELPIGEYSIYQASRQNSAAEPRYTLDEAMDALHYAQAEAAVRPFDLRSLSDIFAARLRFVGATTETGESE
jgi:hypothetical protein